MELKPGDFVTFSSNLEGDPDYDGAVVCTMPGPLMVPNESNGIIKKGDVALILATMLIDSRAVKRYESYVLMKNMTVGWAICDQLVKL